MTLEYVASQSTSTLLHLDRAARDVVGGVSARHTVPRRTPAWGGYTLPTQVPYQPTLPGEVVPQLPLDSESDLASVPANGRCDRPGGHARRHVAHGPACTVAEQYAGRLWLFDHLRTRSQKVAHSARLSQRLLSAGQIHGDVVAATRIDFIRLDRFADRSCHRAAVLHAREPDHHHAQLRAPLFASAGNVPLPPRLHDAASISTSFVFSTTIGSPISPCQPGLYSDDYSFDSSEALRINGRAIGVYAPTVDLKWALGVTYLDGGGWAKVVPVAGVIYTPTDDVEYQLCSPRRAWLGGWPTRAIPGQDEQWVYVQVEYGNSAWAFEQADGTPDVSPRAISA